MTIRVRHLTTMSGVAILSALALSWSGNAAAAPLDTTRAQAKALLVKFGKEYDTFVAQGQTRAYAAQRVDEHFLAVLYSIHGSQRTNLVGAMVTFDDQLASDYPLDGVGLIATTFRQTVSSLGFWPAPPKVAYGVCPAGQEADPKLPRGYGRGVCRQPDSTSSGG